MRKSKVICLVALLVALNIAGSKLSLLIHAPIYLDSIGTIMGGMMFGPIIGGLVALIGGLINGVLGDVYSIYFAPSGILIGIMSGVILHKHAVHKLQIPIKTLAITLPASIVSAIISTFLFSGITSAVFTTFVVQALSKSVLDLFTSAFLVQLVTDYADKFISLILVLLVYKHLPSEYKE